MSCPASWRLDEPSEVQCGYSWSRCSIECFVSASLFLWDGGHRQSLLRVRAGDLGMPCDRARSDLHRVRERIAGEGILSIAPLLVSAR